MAKDCEIINISCLLGGPESRLQIIDSPCVESFRELTLYLCREYNDKEMWECAGRSRLDVIHIFEKDI